MYIEYSISLTPMTWPIRRMRNEKDNRTKAHGEMARANEKVVQLSDHIEKLMV
jgi:hypothetical protein